jgi:hypothetical protein
MSTKEILETVASVAIFQSLNHISLTDIKPISLYLPRRKKITSSGYYTEVQPFTGKPEATYSYFYDIGTLPEMLPLYTENRYTSDRYVYTFKEEDRHFIVRNSVFYFGHVTYNLNKAYSLFVEGRHQDVVDMFASYFKKGFIPEEVENHFPRFPCCTLLDKTFYDSAGSEEAFRHNVRRVLDYTFCAGPTRITHKD